MPELPAVEYSRLLLEQNVINHTIASVIPSDDTIVLETPPEVLAKELTGRKVLSSHRYGKYLWLALSGDAWLLMHFGMTGFVQVQGRGRMYYKSAPESEEGQETKECIEWPPRFWKLQVETDAGVKFVHGDSRRLGKVQLLYKDPMTVSPVSKLGFDPIHSMPKYSDDIFKRVTSRSIPLKTLLLDQSFAAGVGNWMADDIMLHARLHPEIRTNTLNEGQVKRLLDSIEHISVVSVAANSDGDKFPKDWIFHCRWPSARKLNKTPNVDGHKVAFTTVGGRTTVYVPDLQKKTEINLDGKGDKAKATKKRRVGRNKD